jgi:hypothetical protein
LVVGLLDAFRLMVNVGVTKLSPPGISVGMLRVMICPLGLLASELRVTVEAVAVWADGLDGL